jgi:AraC family transcriptional regulator
VAFERPKSVQCLVALEFLVRHDAPSPFVEERARRLQPRDGQSADFRPRVSSVLPGDGGLVARTLPDAIFSRMNDSLLTNNANLAHYTARMNRALDFVAQHLDEPLSLDRISAAAHFSPFHFHRLFQAWTGETVNAYVMRVRLERAIFLRRTTPAKSLTEIAFACGFNSASSFSRAFRKSYGTSLAKADLEALLASRKIGQASPAPIPDDATRVASEKSTLTVHIERWAELRLAYVRVVGGYLAPDKLVAGYQQLERWADSVRIDRTKSLLIGMSMDDPDIVPLAKCRYDFCRTIERLPDSNSGMSWTTLKKCDWAVLHCEGSMQDVASAWTYLFRDWLPRSGFTPAPMPALEIFRQRPEEIGWDRFDIDCCLPVMP